MATKKNKYTSIDLSKYDKGYQASKDVIKAQQNKTNAQSAVANYGDFAYKNQDAYDRALDAITNRKKFTYDLNADAMYQQYKDNYMTQGKQAMMDTMGQASALTGGYGNSYAATVGNQTYQGYLTHLNDVAPELYKLALDKYNNEGNDLLNQLNVLASDRQTQYGEWGDKLNRLLADRDYHSSEYDAAYSRDYNAWNDNRSYDTSQYWNEYNAGYQAERDAIADAQWQKEFYLAQKKYEASLQKNSTDNNVKNPDVQKQNFLTIEDAANYMAERGINNKKVKDVDLYDAREWNRQKSLGNSKPEFKYDSYQDYLSAYVYYVEANQ